jgi:anti-sigma factor RsiW
MTTPPDDFDEPVPPEAEEMVAYLDGELDPTEAERVETRIGLDPAARAQADSLRRAWDMLDYLPRPQPSASFTHRTLEKIDALAPPRPAAASPAWRRAGAALGWAAALLVAVGVGYGGRSLLVPRPAALPPRDGDPQVLADLRVIKNLRLYRDVDDLKFLEEQDHHDLFGEER